MGPVVWPEVAGGGRNRRRNPPGTVAGRGFGPRREGTSFQKWKPPNLKLAIYSKFFPTSVDHNFLIRIPITTYFVSTNSV